ncbi:MAG: YlxR family protein [Corynebacteriales bacterium]|nr:YlxR family protein [Mycobacteriales bacterium]
MHVPTRTCIGCRERGAATELLRVVAFIDDSGEQVGATFAVVPDLARKLPGRGAWMHRDPACMAAAARRQAFARALRIAGKPQLDALAEAITGAGS